MQNPPALKSPGLHLSEIKDTESEMEGTTPEQTAAMIQQAFDHGMKNLEFHIASSEILSRDSTTFLNIISTAGLGALGYTVHLIEVSASRSIWVGTAAVSVHLLLVSWQLIRQCIWSDDLSPAWNEAKNLYHPGYTASAVLLAEIKAMPIRLRTIVARNAKVGSALNRLRRKAFLAPATFVSIWIISEWVFPALVRQF